MTDADSPIQVSGDTEDMEHLPSLWQRLLPLFVGLLAFLVGLIWFLPLNQLAREALSRFSSENLSVEVSEIYLGVFGGFDVLNLRLATQGGDSPVQLSVSSATGRLSLWGLLMGNFNFRSELQGLQFKKGAIQVSGGVWELRSSVSGIRKSVSFFKGDGEIQASSFLLVYDEPLPMLGETLEVPISSLKLQGKIDQGIFRIQSGLVESRLAKIVLNGSLGLAPSSPIDISIVVTPTEELYQKYQDKGLREILNSFKVLQADGRLQFQLSGTLSRPVFRALSSDGQGP